MTQSMRPLLVMRMPDGRKVPYDPTVIGFEHEGRLIFNPLQTADGSWVNATVYGFQPYHTGGGCMALRKDLPNGNYLLLTTDDGCHIPDEPEDAEDAFMGLYAENGEPLADVNLRDVP